MTRPITPGTHRRSCRTCGWTGTYPTPRRADYAKSRHSCRKHLEAAAKKARGETRMAAVDRTPKPCHHKVADHQHGTNAAYVLDKCRCHPCARARHAQDDWRIRQQAYGRYDKYVDADPVRAHVRDLMAQGIGLKRIATLSGIGSGTLWKLLYGKPRPGGTRVPSKRVLRETAEKLQGVTVSPTTLAAGQLDPARTPDAKERLRALVAIGWSMTKLGARLGIRHPGNAATLITSDRDMVRSTVDAALELFDELCMTPAPALTQRDKIAATRARQYAADRGWAPPLALPDLDSDPDDGAGLDHAAIERRLAGDKTVPLTPAERTELRTRWLTTGRSLNDLERTTGINAHRPATPKENHAA